MDKYVIFTSYLLAPTGGTFGRPYTQAIHCNYIKKIVIETDNINTCEVRINFAREDDFKFLNNNPNSTGTGFTANKIYALIQLIDCGDSDPSEIEPVSSEWRIFDVTDQIDGHGNYLSGYDLASTLFRVPLKDYGTYNVYNLNYLGYPTSNQTDDLCFGDETFFFGNVQTEIRADVYTTDISINLPLNQFNFSDNLTWDGTSKVYITEVGIYDKDKNLVAIGKLNNPVPKDATISRTIVFAIDF